MIGFIGGGNMAEALIKGIKDKQCNILVSEPSEDRRIYLEQTYGVKTTSDNKEIASSCGIIILAVKPQIMQSVLNDISASIGEDKTVVSIAAGITLTYLQSKLKTKKLIRIMPNTPALVQQGMSVMSMCDCFPDKDINVVREIFMSVGHVLTLKEKHMDAVTAVSGSGPAFIALFVEAMIEAGIGLGLTEDCASELAIQTLIGTAEMLKTGMTPQRLREMVTSPGGTTAAGLKSFDENGLKKIINEALTAAKTRAEELGRRQ
jgi:pyrroline-5-carboxylate reductase